LKGEGTKKTFSRLKKFPKSPKRVTHHQRIAAASRFCDLKFSELLQISLDGAKKPACQNNR
jgi:hypothetical protein